MFHISARKFACRNIALNAVSHTGRAELHRSSHARPAAAQQALLTGEQR